MLFILSSFSLSWCMPALNPRRRSWYGHLLSCPPPLPPRWTLKCPIRGNQGVPAANHSLHPATRRPWVPKEHRAWQGPWGWRMARAWPLVQAPRSKSKGREAPQWSRTNNQRLARPPVRRKVNGTTASTKYYYLSLHPASSWGPNVSNNLCQVMWVNVHVWKTILNVVFILGTLTESERNVIGEGAQVFEFQSRTDSFLVVCLFVHGCACQLYADVPPVERHTS